MAAFSRETGQPILFYCEDCGFEAKMNFLALTERSEKYYYRREQLILNHQKKKFGVGRLW